MSALTTTGTYTLVCTGSGGTASQSVTITVTNPPTVSIAASPSTVASGESSQLSWSSTNATACTASNTASNSAWTGAKTASSATSTQTLSALTTTGSYTLMCTGTGGSTAQSVTITVASSGSNPIDSLQPGQWVQIPNSKIRSVVMDPLPTGVYAVEGPGAVVWSWSGGAYDTKRDRLLVWGGGHTAYAGNEIYAFDLNSLRWIRVTDPSSIVGHDGGSTYPDGRPASVHSYDQIEYDPVADRMFVFGGSRYPTGSNTTSAFTFNFDSNDWTKVSDIPGDWYSQIIGLSLTSAYDPVTGLVYVGGAWGTASYKVATNEWKILSVGYGTWELPNGLTGALDPKRRKLIQIGRGYAFSWDMSQASPPRSNFVSSGDKEIEQCDAPGLDYDPVYDLLVAWCKTSDVYTLNLDTKVWTRITATGGVTPGDPYAENSNYHGTFGRFRYVPSKNVFVVVTDIDKDVYVYKLPSTSAPGATDFTTLTVTNTSGSSKTNPVATFGQVFKAGDVPAGATVAARLPDHSVVPLQVDKKATHADGSLRHAVLTAKLPSLSNNGSAAITLTSQAVGATSTAISVADVLATSFDAQANLTVGGVAYSASARSLLQSGSIKQWLAGPQVSEWIVGGPVKTAGGAAHEHLAAYFHVRAYADSGTTVNRVRVDTVIENNWNLVPNPSDFTYDVTLSVGGSTVYSQNALTHFTRARWHKTFWWGGDSGLYVAHDKNYLQDSKAVSKYMNVTPPDSVLAGQRSSVNPMELGDNRSYMASTGENGMIGPQPEWVSLYLVSMDRRAYVASLRNADGGGTYSSHYRDEVTGYPAITDNHPNMQIGNNTTTWVPPILSSSPHQWDIDHQPALAYVPYLVTGDYYYLEELQFWTEANMFMVSPGTRLSMIGLQVRGQAWSLRTLGQAAYITPDAHPLKLHLIDKVKLYVSKFDEQYTNNASANKLGVIWSVDDIDSADKLSHGYFTVWMDDYLTWAVGHLVELGFTEAIPFRNWKTKFPVDRLSRNDYCWQVATPSQLRMGTGLVWYPDIATVYQTNFPAALTGLTCGTAAYSDWIRVNWGEAGFLVNEMTPYGNDPEGHPSKTQPAMAIAVDAGTANASVGWSRLSTRADPPNYALNPKYAIVPR